MSRSLEDLLDLTLDVRLRGGHQHAGKSGDIHTAVDADHRDLEHKQIKFVTAVGSLIHQAIERANRHLASRPEHYRFCEISGYYTGPLYAGGSACNPIAYELRAGGKTVGETLLVELTHDGMIEGSLGPLYPSTSQAARTKIAFGWDPVSLDAFDETCAVDLVVRYIAAISGRWPWVPH